MKKIGFAVAAVIIAVSIIVTLAGLHIANRNDAFEVFEGTDITENVDEYIKSQSKEKAPEMNDAVWLRETKDVPFDTEDEKFQKAVRDIKESYFDTVFLSSEYYSAKKDESLSTDGDSKGAIEYIKNQKLKVYLRIDSSHDVETVCEMAKICDGIIVSGSDEIEKLNSKLLKIKAAVLIENKNAKVFAELSEKADISKFNKRSVHGIYLAISKNSSFETVKKWSDASYVSDTKLILGFDLDSTMQKKTSADFVLRQMFELRDLDAVFMRCLSSYKAVKSDYQNSFSAIEKYITEGIATDISFREIGITGYNGETVQTTDFAGEIEIYGSDLFPMYLNGEKMSLGENGSRKLTLSLEEGTNEFTVSQCQKELVYKVNVSFDGDILKSVTPENEMVLYPKETAAVTVVGYYKAEISVKVGTKEYTAKAVDKTATGYVAFTAKIKMPDTREEVASLGMITVIGTYGGDSMQLKGAVISPAEEKPDISNSGGEEKTTTPVKIENYVPSLPGNIQQNIPGNIQPSATIGQLQTPSVSQPQQSTPSQTSDYTGNEMALIAANYADTRPLIYNDDTYTPSCSALVKGTVDYITAESEAYNKEYGEQVYFYELASGAKVLREDVQLIPKQDMGDNSISVISCTGDGGTLKIRLSTSWKVPYTISFTPQTYFSQYGTKFNITNFAANYIQITFHHTISANGNVDASLSNVISAASWNVSAANKTATLYMPIRALGEYYGCSVEYDESGYMVITVHNKPQALAGSVILLDPGHGGSDPGALGYGGAVEECDVNLALAYYTKEALEARGAIVYSTRGGDDTLELEDRKAMARSLKPDFFISIHSNASENTSMIGTATYYYKPFSKKLANNIYSEMLSVFKSTLYNGQANLYDTISDGTPYYPFSVTRLDECPSVLIETGYVSNNEECYKLIQSQNQQLLGEAIAKGIEKTVLG